MRLEIHCQNRLGMVHEILDLFLLHQIDLQLIEVGTHSDQLYVGMPDVAFAQLQLLLGAIRRINGVHDVKVVHFTPTERAHYATWHLLEAMPDGVVSVDLGGRITLATHQAARDLGRNVAELIGSKIADVAPGLARVDWRRAGSLGSKRIRINSQLILTEFKPVTIPNDEGEPILAGGVIFLRSAKRINRQQERLLATTEQFDGEVSNTMLAHARSNGENEMSSVRVELVEDSLEKTIKNFEKKLLEGLFPSYPSSRKLAKKLGMSHGAIALKLREYGISKKT
ncbi:PAS domain-containing protein [Maribrevibacterium harenarium]|uniref:PAS domain-containing protein n=1 Tax=Maribrevibacterium harenarium TaxID=2589817 RepID=A0A501WXG4_9GAMM|nr:TyrR/PhhR family helix-turn-helix DNA-binding protein [Maribrevibacterium harenarium]TPE50576.1 PAS domain-containing protein [Maribrevibacterium harenarium]